MFDHSKKIENHMIRILSLDGGGILGIVPAMVLTALETKIQQKTGNPDDRLIHYLDFLAGTSTGGIIACILACPRSGDDPTPRYSAADAAEFYQKYGSQIFRSSWMKRTLGSVGLADERYDSAEIERLLKKHFGEIRLSQLLRPCLVPAYNLEQGVTWFFCKHDHDNGEKPFRDFLVRDVCRSTSAAPSYFEPSNVFSLSKIRHPFIDGGVFANNPTLCAIAEVSKADGAFTPDNMLILSMGTGSVHKSFKFSRFKKSLALLIVPDLIKIMMSGVAETTHHIVKNIFQNLGVAKNYIRIDAKFTDPKVASMDNARPENIERLREAADQLIAENDALLDTIAERLISEPMAARNEPLSGLESFELDSSERGGSAPPKMNPVGLRWSRK